jgi:hypothetical protein
MDGRVGRAKDNSDFIRFGVDRPADRPKLTTACCGVDVGLHNTYICRAVHKWEEKGSGARGGGGVKRN